MQEAQSWRELLKAITRDAGEKQRLVSTLGITQLTLTRWINGDSDPRSQNIRQLLNALPQHRAQLYELLKKEPALLHAISTNSPSPTEIPHTIPADFYQHVLALYTSTNSYARFWTLSSVILQQLLQQVDTKRYGLYTSIVRCMPISGPQRKVRSLRESVGFGTTPWTENVEQNALFSGAESLAGNTVALCRATIIQDYSYGSNAPLVSPWNFVKSCVLFPILFAGRVAGALVVASTRANFFVPSDRIELIQLYADLVALAFDSADFYATEQIALGVMPPYEEQRKYFSQYQRMVAETLLQHPSRFVEHNEATLLVWQKLEDMLLQLSVTQAIQYLE
jgi:GAF domain-containing protein